MKINQAIRREYALALTVILNARDYPEDFVMLCWKTATSMRRMGWV